MNAGSLRTIRVDLGPRSYDVVVGRGAKEALPDMIPPDATKAVVVTQPGIGIEVLTGLPTTVLEIPPGEASKSLRTVETLCRGFAQAGLTRNDVVVAVGGGVVTDVAGYAASCWHRGTGVIHVATTLLAQVDAAIGGKTGVNLPEGKNLVGTFWQPLGVICDTGDLASLPPPEWRSGRGEVAKYAFLGVGDLHGLDLDDQVAACVECKARVVSADEREGGLRMVLNYGHTLAHALEAAGFAGESGEFADASTGVSTAAPAPVLRHGEAVAVGLVFAARLARALGRIDDARVAVHDRILAEAELPGRLPEGVDPGKLVELMARDKKALGDLTFVLDGPRGVEVVRGVPRDTVTRVLCELAS